MVTDIQDNPPPQATVWSVYMWKCRPWSPSQSWPCMIIHNPYWILNQMYRYPSFFEFPSVIRSHSGFCRANFRFFDTNFCFKTEISALRDTRHAESCPGLARQSVYMKKSCPACQGYSSCRVVKIIKRGFPFFQFVRKLSKHIFEGHKKSPCSEWNSVPLRRHGNCKLKEFSSNSNPKWPVVVGFFNSSGVV